MVLQRLQRSAAFQAARYSYATFNTSLENNMVFLHALLVVIACTAIYSFCLLWTALHECLSSKISGDSLTNFAPSLGAGIKKSNETGEGNHAVKKDESAALSPSSQPLDYCIHSGIRANEVIPDFDGPSFISPTFSTPKLHNEVSSSKARSTSKSPAHSQATRPRLDVARLLRRIQMTKVTSPRRLGATRMTRNMPVPQLNRKENADVPTSNTGDAANGSPPIQSRRIREAHTLSPFKKHTATGLSKLSTPLRQRKAALQRLKNVRRPHIAEASPSAKTILGRSKAMPFISVGVDAQPVFKLLGHTGRGAEVGMASIDPVVAGALAALPQGIADTFEGVPDFREQGISAPCAVHTVNHILIEHNPSTHAEMEEKKADQLLVRSPLSTVLLPNTNIDISPSPSSRKRRIHSSDHPDWAVATSSTVNNTTINTTTACTSNSKQALGPRDSKPVGHIPDKPNWALSPSVEEASPLPRRPRPRNVRPRKAHLNTSEFVSLSISASGSWSSSGFESMSGSEGCTDDSVLEPKRNMHTPERPNWALATVDST